MAYQITIDVRDDGRIDVRAPVPPPLAATILRDAYDLIHGQVLTAMVVAQLEAKQRVALAPAGALTRLNGGGAPI